jgi:2-methylcitrate dehydratase PrpD
MEVTKTLAQYVVNSRYADIPRDVRHEASRALLNLCGCSIGGASHPTVENALSAVHPFAGPGQASILGRTEKLDILNAALLNGISSHVLDFDDTHVEAIHPSAPVWPALLALAEWKGVSGADVIHAFVIGVEVECRVGLAVVPQHYDVGWHITSTVGVLGAAAAAGKILGLDQQRMAWALGIAATQASGLREMFGSMCKCLHPGRAAQNGLHAAFLAANGFTSSEHAIEAPRGFGHVLSTRFDPAPIIAPWGQSFELMRNMYKPFACGLVVHGAIDGCMQLRSEYGLTPDMVDRIDLKVGKIVLELTGKTEPRTGLEGKFSVFHAAAAALCQGAGGEIQFSDECVNDPAVAGLRRRVHATVDESLSWAQAHVMITLKDGRKLERMVKHPMGSLEHPMSDRDLEAKFVDLTDGILDKSRQKNLIKLCWGLENLADAGVIARAGALV